MSEKIVKFSNFKRKYFDNKKEISSALGKVFDRGWFILGPELIKFEKKMGEFLSVKYVVGVNSGTDAIFLALKAHGIKDGDEVITTSHTATPTISAIRMTGAKPVFVDINESDMNMNPALIEKNITFKTKAIVPVHLYGYPADMSKILTVAKKHKLFVIEDACQAHGAKFNGKFVGTLGHAGCFSFYPTKNLGAFGDAGAVVTKDKKIAESVKALRNYGEVSKFNNEIEGVNSRLDEIQAAVLIWGLSKLKVWNKKRSKYANFYIKELKDLPLVLPPSGDDKFNCVWHLFVIRTEKRDELQAFLKKRGIETMIHYPIPAFKQPAYSFLKYKNSDLPVTVKTASQILSIPLYPEMEKEEVFRVCRAIKEFYRRV